MTDDASEADLHRTPTRGDEQDLSRGAGDAGELVPDTPPEEAQEKAGLNAPLPITPEAEKASSTDEKMAQPLSAELGNRGNGKKRVLRSLPLAVGFAVIGTVGGMVYLRGVDENRAAGSESVATITNPIPARGILNDSNTSGVRFHGRVALDGLEKGARLSEAELCTMPDTSWWVLDVPLRGVSLRAGQPLIALGTQVATGAVEQISSCAVVLQATDSTVDSIVRIALAPAEARDAASYLLPDRRLLLVQRIGQVLSRP